MKKLIPKLSKNDKGQTVVEYIILVAVVISIIIGIFKILKRDVLNFDADCEGGSSSVICLWQNSLNGANFRYFTIRR